jgi:hypothetical protein
VAAVAVDAALTKAAPDQMGACEGRQSSGRPTLGCSRAFDSVCFAGCTDEALQHSLGFGRGVVGCWTADVRQPTIEKPRLSGILRAISMLRSTSVTEDETIARVLARALDRSALDGPSVDEPSVRRYVVLRGRTVPLRRNPSRLVRKSTRRRLLY